MEDLELQRRMKAVGIPTADADVRATLRVLGEPVTLFGEREVREMARGTASKGCGVGGVAAISAFARDL